MSDRPRGPRGHEHGHEAGVQLEEQEGKEGKGRSALADEIDAAADGDHETGRRSSRAELLAELRAEDERFMRWLARQKNLGSALQAICNRQRMSILEASYLAGIDDSYLWRIMHGQRHPSRDILIALASCAFGLSARQVSALLELANYSRLRG